MMARGVHLISPIVDADQANQLIFGKPFECSVDPIGPVDRLNLNHKSQVRVEFVYKERCEHPRSVVLNQEKRHGSHRYTQDFI